MDEYVQYFVVNKELNMSSGKIAAQVAHAATMTTNYIAIFKKDIYLTWLKWFQNDQKKIILRGREKDLLKLLKQLPDSTVEVRDNGYTEIPTNSLTVVGIYPMRRSEICPYVKRLQLL